ncbi:hypothetical protein B0H10DRAFT_2099023 [Mycena sp. CBHHK59/15]|nr:hypothetical protein B0H10DRAFT_2099023 [Mycena sp. CBHHK59/15]
MRAAAGIGFAGRGRVEAGCGWVFCGHDSPGSFSLASPSSRWTTHRLLFTYRLRRLMCRVCRIHPIFLSYLTRIERPTRFRVAGVIPRPCELVWHMCSVRDFVSDCIPGIGFCAASHPQPLPSRARPHLHFRRSQRRRCPALTPRRARGASSLIGLGFSAAPYAGDTRAMIIAARQVVSPIFTSFCSVLIRRRIPRPRPSGFALHNDSRRTFPHWRVL